MVRLLRGFRAFVLVSAVGVIAASCAGKSVSSDVADVGTGGGAVPGTGGATGGAVGGGTGGAVGDGTGATGAVGATGGGTGATGAVGATGGTGGATPVAGSGGSAGATGLCALPPQAGQCLALHQRFYFDVETGQCLEFNYGGCDGNANRFMSRGACLARCAGGEDRTRCNDPSDCTLVDAECCGCAQELKDVAAVSKFYDEEFPGILTCPEIPCPVCEKPRSPYLFVTCENGLEQPGYCAAYDLLQLGANQCSVDSDCRLRRGLECCECGGEIVSVSVNVDIERLTCGSGGCAADCDPPAFPALTHAICRDGQCAVAIE